MGICGRRAQQEETFFYVFIELDNVKAVDSRVSTESSYLIRTETAFPWVNANEQCVFPGCSHLPSFNANNTNNPDTALLQQSGTFRVVHINLFTLTRFLCKQYEILVIKISRTQKFANNPVISMI